MYIFEIHQNSAEQKWGISPTQTRVWWWAIEKGRPEFQTESFQDRLIMENLAGMLSHPIQDNNRCKKPMDKGRALDDVGNMGIRGSPMMSGVWQYRGRHNCHHGSFAGRAFSAQIKESSALT